MSITHVDLPGNTRPLKQGATRLGVIDPNQAVQITVVVRGKQELPEPDRLVAPLTITDIERNYGADPEDVALVSRVLEGYGLKVIASSAGSRTVDFEGSAAQMDKAFSVDLGLYKTSEQGEYRGRQGDIQIPVELAGVVEAVLGLDERKVARRHAGAKQQAMSAGLITQPVPTTSAATVGPQAPSDIETRYSFPAGAAANQTVGILEFGGGYFESDLALYCDQISKLPQPNVTVVPVGLNSLSLKQIEALHNKQQQAQEFDASGEVNMDVQIVAGLCSQANILVYFAPFTQRGWLNILRKAIHDPNGPKVISVSWGAVEDDGELSAAAITAINNMLKTAAAVGVTICVSSGDDGAGDAANDGLAHCDFPASSPYVLAVGGTMFPSGDAEQGWWDTPGARTGSGGGSSGGGRSTVFQTPSWQNVDVVSVRTGQAEGRCIPDVSALSGAPLYNLIFVGQVSPNGGTSASAPVWASLIARIAGSLPSGQTVGFLTPLLYQVGPNGQPLGASITTDMVAGNNDVLAYQDNSTDPPTVLKAVTGYQAGPGYDAVTGWGVPIGTALQNAL